MTCRVCEVSVPSGEFCGNCGATRHPRRGDGPRWLRMSAYSAAAGQRLPSPSVTSTVFPALPRRSRTAFSVALIGLVGLVLGTALPMWQAALIGLVCFGLPLLFLLYLRETDAFSDLSVASLLTTIVLAIALGVGWGLATNVAAARTDDDALGLPVSPVAILVTVLAVPLGFLVLMLAPMVIVRFWRAGVRESLNGFVFGSLAALCFTSAFSLSRLAPQFADGPVNDDGQSPLDLGIAGIIQGIVVPLTATAIGGAIGVTLWFRRRTDSRQQRRWYALTAPTPPIAVGVAVYLALGLLDLLSVSNDVETVSYAVLAVLALYVLRIVVHSALLHEEPDRMSPDDVLLCAQCDHVVPDLPFCCRCGVAGHAASRSSRAARRATRPIPVAQSADG